MFYLYLFEAKSIQSYIFATSKLREVVGGSEMIEQLTADGGLLSGVIAGLDAGGDIKLARCGGAAFYAYSENQQAVDELATLWPLVFRQYAPDLSFVQARAHDEDYLIAFEAGRKQLAADRNRPEARLPQASVYSRRFGRTGEPATGEDRVDGEMKPVDQLTQRKLQFCRNESLLQRLKKDSKLNEWPINLTPEKQQPEARNFPFIEDKRTIGLIHADGNGFGQLLLGLQGDLKRAGVKGKDYAKIFYKVSAAIKKATESAAERAVNQTLAEQRNGQTYPARPIVLGGDDLTIVVRADLALPFTLAFLQAFEEESAAKLSDIRANNEILQEAQNFPTSLTACAGIVYAKSSQPFLLLHDLAENLCGHAKSVAKLTQENGQAITPSAVSFYRVTTSLIANYSDILQQELTISVPGSRPDTDTNTQQEICLSRSCYALTSDTPLPNIHDLLALQRFLDNPEVSLGALRQVSGLLHQSADQAQRRYDRWQEVMAERDKDQQLEYLSLLQKLSTTDVQPLRFAGAGDDASEKLALPFEDALSLSAVDNQIEEPETMGTTGRATS